MEDHSINIFLGNYIRLQTIAQALCDITLVTFMHNIIITPVTCNIVSAIYVIAPVHVLV